MATTATLEENLNNGIPTERQNSEELNGQQGKRKFSLSQYKERKRLRPEEFHYADTDMRIFPSKVSPPATPTKCDEPPVVIKSNLSEPGVKKETKKKVIWADEKNQSLVQTSFFEVDDSELAEMHLFARPSSMSNMSIAQLEKVMERDLRQRRHGLTNENSTNSFDLDDKQSLAPLAPLIKIYLPEHIHPPTIISQERFVQEEREKTVFQALLIRSFLPDSPAEPDQDVSSTNSIERQEAKLIPLDDDANGNKTSTSTCPSAAAPVSSQSTSNKTNPFADLSPEVAQILAQAKGNTITANNPSTTTTTTTQLPNLPAPPNFLSNLFNVQRTDSPTVPTNNPITNILPNLAVNFNLPPPPPPPAQFPFGHLLASALSLALPPATNSNSSAIFSPAKVPSVRFVSAIGQQTRPTVPPPSSSSTTTTNNEHSERSPENSRDQYRRPNNSHHHHHHHHHNRNQQQQRRDYYPNRSNNRNLY